MQYIRYDLNYTGDFSALFPISRLDKNYWHTYISLFEKQSLSAAGLAIEWAFLSTVTQIFVILLSATSKMLIQGPRKFHLTSVVLGLLHFSPSQSVVQDLKILQYIIVISMIKECHKFYIWMSPIPVTIAFFVTNSCPALSSLSALLSYFATLFLKNNWLTIFSLLFLAVLIRNTSIDTLEYIMLWR